MIYLLSEKRLKADFLNDNIASELILPSIQTAQDIFLRQTLGDSLLDKICNLVRDNELDEPYKTLLDEYVIIYLEYLAMAELCVPSTFKLGNIGVAQAYDNNVNSQTIQNVKYLESYYKQKASFYENRLTTFIQQHCNLFPEYRDTTTVTTAQESTLQCGIYLGGTTSRKKIINNTNNNNTEVGNYVRYDKAQNLSELEKAQARENIGVSANGDIVVDLENYYTKDETYNKNQVDTKLAPYITSNEVNLRLNSYYDKSQTDTAIQNAIDNIEIPETDLSDYYTKETVNNLLDNLPIPEYTSELVKDDVYTKTETYSKEEVDSLVDNVEVDLSNYYTKQETGTAIQTAIESIETFSGNYNDLTNKPDIYTKTEVDNLIDNIPLFSGDYNDLENKPKLFSGSYNDLSDKPIVDLLSLPYYEQVNQIDFYSDIFMFVGGYIMTIEGIILNGNKCVYEIIGNSDDGMPIKQVDFHINRTKDSFIIRFITRYNEANENIPYEFIYTNENGDMLDTLNLVTKSELDETIGNINNILNMI